MTLELYTAMKLHSLMSSLVILVKTPFLACSFQYFLIPVMLDCIHTKMVIAAGCQFSPLCYIYHVTFYKKYWTDLMYIIHQSKLYSHVVSE